MKFISTTDDPSAIKPKVAELNQKLSEGGFIAGDARLRSEFAIVTSRGLSDGIVQPVFDPEILETETFEGVFLGCDVAELGDGPELVYTLEMPLDTKTMRFRTVIAPVNLSRVAVKSREHMGNVTDKDELASSLGLLAAITDPEFQVDLRSLTRLFEEYDSSDHAFVRELGRITTHMLANPFVGMDDQARTAIGKIIDSCFKDKGMYAITGEIFEMKPTQRGRTITVDSVELLGVYKGIGLSPDYRIVNSPEGDIIELAESHQPVILVPDNNGKLLRIPLKSIHSIEWQGELPSQVSCQLFREQYLNGYYDNGPLA